MSDLQGGVKVPLLVSSSVALVSPDIGVSVAAVRAVPGFDDKMMMIGNDPTIFHIHSFICTVVHCRR